MISLNFNVAIFLIKQWFHDGNVFCALIEHASPKDFKTVCLDGYLSLYNGTETK